MPRPALVEVNKPGLTSFCCSGGGARRKVEWQMAELLKTYFINVIKAQVITDHPKINN